VAFVPPGAGEWTAVLRVEAGGASAAVDLAGRAAAPRLEVSPPALEFGPVRLSRTAELSVTLASSTPMSLQLQQLRLTGPAAPDFQVLPGGGCAPGLVVPPGLGCTLRVRFAPTVEGGRLATLVLSHDGAGGPLEMPLSGAGTPAPRPQPRLEPAELAFGEQVVGVRSGILTITLSNRGDERLRLSAPAITGLAAGDFYVVPGSCEGASFLAPAGSCTIGVRFVPTAAGDRAARLVIRHDAGESAVRLLGRGVGAP
jgi:hypothetical protein